MDAFAKRVALVTGAGSGLGRELARTLARRGAAVIAAVDLTEPPLIVLADELAGSGYAWAVADVTDRDALHAAVSKLQERLGPVDLLIANAGIGLETSALSFKAADFEAQVRVNLVGVANSIEAVLPGMLERQRGQLVAISSLASYRGLPKMAGYCASKAGVNALMDAVRVEVKPRGIDVTTICPGWIRTPLTENIDVPKPDILEVDEAARRIVEAIRWRRSFYAFPARVAWRVGLPRSAPAAPEERELLQVLLADESLVPSALAEVPAEMIQHPGLRRLLEGLYDLHRAGQPATLDQLRPQLESVPLAEHALKLQDVGRRNPDPADWLRQILSHFRQRRQRPVKEELHNQLQAASDHSTALGLLRQLQNRSTERDEGRGTRDEG